MSQTENPEPETEPENAPAVVRIGSDNADELARHYMENPSDSWGDLVSRALEDAKEYRKSNGS